MNKDQWRQRCEQEMGKPYIWGADGPDAYDCSGFAQFALGLLNLDPPGDQTANGLYRYFGKGRSQPVERVSDAALGDLVFFGTDEGVIHIALAWGGGQMLEAGGGGHKTTSVAIARAQHAEVRISAIAKRHDFVGILRPQEVPWVARPEGAPRLEDAGGPGSFTGLPPLTEWLSDGRHMQLKRPFGYLDANGRDWPVPAETVVDGASIPRIFWSLIGGPLEGPYRNASIVHDHYCVVRTTPWRDVHRMFHDAMLCGGVTPMKARVMYYAVYRFGPRWTSGPSIELAGFAQTESAAAVPTSVPAQAFDATSFVADAERIEAEALDLNAIDALADAHTAPPAGRVQVESMPAPLTPATDQEATLAAIAADTRATLARLPLLTQLVALQDSVQDPATEAAVGTLLSRFNALDRIQFPVPTEEATALAFSDLKPEYEKLFASCQIRPEKRSEVAWHRDKLVQYRPRYEVVGQRVGIPWWFIGVVHALEASFNFQGHLHNGDPLSARTVQVPKGRPPVWNPPNDWESSAVDALTYEKLAGLTDWSLAAVLYRWEKYNGMGYHARNIPSPYLWSYSNHYTSGKFVKDGQWDPTAVSRQCGAAVMLLALQEAGLVHL